MFAVLFDIFDPPAVELTEPFCWVLEYQQVAKPVPVPPARAPATAKIAPVGQAPVASTEQLLTDPCITMSDIRSLLVFKESLVFLTAGPGASPGPTGADRERRRV